CIQALEFPWTF
nr:immunoglobulin light chain junction region [Macaca mulatta]MOV34719.1 immunoglobulin light chain junction region [Macaca mulatta]MOV35443.1 immunoglobulin light chain junction region [Macaca mulatta]MOV77544.1 immunoglobulin light chain junction region [Macaca mulatta]MOV77629.1 immunoglobulin light chain junction region [Macaca mulatta]